jgi:asparagine synthase (glutamine-hydrolysing)
MSAIAGIIHFDEQPVAERELRAMTAALARPRAEAVLLMGGQTGLGHCLTRFTDEDKRERQPLTSAGGRYSLVAAGRVDNRPELCETLRISASEAARLPDSALIMAAIEKWDDDSPRHLIGAFAFAAWDHRNRSLLLARSPRGEYSVYYWTDGHRFFFASAPKALFALPFISRRVNLRRVANHLVSLPNDPSVPWFEGIASLEPGRSLVIRPGRMDVRRFWRLEPGREIRLARDSDYVEAFDELWSRVVSDQMRSTGGVGIMMSGGLDSTAIAATAARALASSGLGLAAFTEVPPQGFSGYVPSGFYADETPYVRAVAQKFPNIDLSLITPRSRFFLEGVERYFEAAESPFRTGFNRLWIEAICSAAQERQIPVMLSGQAGNLTISWYGTDLIRRLLIGGRWPEAWRQARALVGAGHARSAASALAAAGSHLLPEPVWSAIFRLRYPGNPTYANSAPWRRLSLIATDFAREQDLARRLSKSGNIRIRPDPARRVRLLGLAGGGADGFRATESMFGVQFRHPADDQRIVEFCIALPESQHLRDGVTRWLIKRAMAGKLPDEILRNRSRGYQSAARFDKLGLGGAPLREALESCERSPLVRHVIDLPRLHETLSRIPAAAGPEATQMAALAASALMMGRFLVWAETGN